VESIPERRNNMLVKRIISAAAGIIYLIIVLYFRGWLFNISVLIISLLGMHEFYASVRKKGHKPVSLLGYLYTIVFFYFVATGLNSPIIPASAIIAAIAALFITVIIPRTTVMDACFTITGFIYPGMTLITLIMMVNLPQPYAHYLLIFTMAATWSTDTFAYFIGIRYGKNKLCPGISPKKTVEGSLGGLGGSVLSGIITGWILQRFYQLPIGYEHYIIMSIICGFASQAGDLAASSIKRFCGIKDFGNILPGHGGILDRFDSIMFTVPVIYAYYLICLV
jgi:phosphatidate cytidylyltransferase